MQLKDYIPNIDKRYGETFFSGISFDSSKVKKDNIFFAIKGNKLDGNNYINLAIKKGAKIIVSEKKIKKRNNIIFLHSSNVRKLLAEISFKTLKKKPKKIVAVTGTNGKSSVVDFYYQLLVEAPVDNNQPQPIPSPNIPIDYKLSGTFNPENQKEIMLTWALILDGKYRENTNSKKRVQF